MEGQRESFKGEVCELREELEGKSSLVAALQTDLQSQALKLQNLPIEDDLQQLKQLIN